MNPKFSPFRAQAAHAFLSSKLVHIEMGSVHSYTVNNRFEESETILATFRDPIAEVFSEQIADRENNKLPTAYYGGQKNNPMLMATRMFNNANGSGKTEKAAVSIRTRYAGTPDKPLLLGARVVDKRGNPTSEILDSIPASKDITKKNKFNFPVKDGSKLYEIVAGMDINGNGKLESNEVSSRFYGTHATGVYDGIHYPLGSKDILHSKDKIRIFTKSDVLAAREKTLGLANNGSGQIFPTAAALLEQGFVGGRTTLTIGNDTINSATETVASNDSRLTHPLGANWGIGDTAQIKKYEFLEGSKFSETFLESDGVENFITAAINENKELFRVTGNTGDEREIVLTKKASINFGATDNGKDLHFAIGNCTFTATLKVKFKITGVSSADNRASKIKVMDVHVTGVAEDLYDYNYCDPPITKFFTTIETQSPASLQAAFASLASELGYHGMGGIFFTEVRVDKKRDDINLSLILSP